MLRIFQLVAGPEAQPPPAAPHLLPAAALPPECCVAAVAALLDLEQQQYMGEGASAAVLGAVVEAGLPCLPPRPHAEALRQVWPAIARVADSAERLRLFAGAWSAAVEGAGEEGGGT